MKNLQLKTNRKLWWCMGMTVFAVLWFAPVLPPGIDWVRPVGLWVELFKAVFTQEVPSDTRLLVIMFLGLRILPFALLFAVASFAVGWVLQGLVVAVLQLIKNI